MIASLRLIAVVLAPRIEQEQPGLGNLKYVAGVAFAVLLYLSVLLHEISHAVMAQRYGLPAGDYDRQRHQQRGQQGGLLEGEPHPSVVRRRARPAHDRSA